MPPPPQKKEKKKDFGSSCLDEGRKAVDKGVTPLVSVGSRTAAPGAGELSQNLVCRITLSSCSQILPSLLLGLLTTDRRVFYRTSKREAKMS